MMGTIESAIGLHCLRDQRFHGSSLGDIRLHKDCFPTVFGDHMDGLISTVLLHIGNNQFGAFSGKGQRRGPTNA
jgi:hypothetical protein